MTVQQRSPSPGRPPRVLTLSNRLLSNFPTPTGNAKDPTQWIAQCTGLRTCDCCMALPSDDGTTGVFNDAQATGFEAHSAIITMKRKDAAYGPCTGRIIDAGVTDRQGSWKTSEQEIITGAIYGNLAEDPQGVIAQCFDLRSRCAAEEREVDIGPVSGVPGLWWKRNKAWRGQLEAKSRPPRCELKAQDLPRSVYPDRIIVGEKMYRNVKGSELEYRDALGNTLDLRTLRS
ncbi:MAG: hypothetical protein M1825_000577 [Sarcosagium campestre]|nr:MAG: hypothetical protein M1825_000577 [Sarcosagium campestre]